MLEFSEGLVLVITPGTQQSPASAKLPSDNRNHITYYKEII